MSINKQHIGYILNQLSIAIIIAMAAVGMASCSVSDTLIDELPPDHEAIAFGASVDKDIQSRGTTIDEGVLKNESYGVLAFYTNSSNWDIAAAAAATPNFMYNQQVVWSGNKWGYSPIKYWPNNEGHKVSFFAYAPYQVHPKTTENSKGIVLSDNSATGPPTIAFTVKDTPTEMIDLVTAQALNQVRSGTAVTFQFNHALSRIAFSAKAAANYGATNIKVTGVSIQGAFYPSGLFDIANGLWSSFGVPASESVTYAPVLNDNANALTTTSVEINADNQYLLVVPQDFAGDNKLTIKATYTMVTDGVESPVQTLTEQLNHHFEQGKAYKFNLNLGLGDLNYKIGITVSDWEGLDYQQPVEF